jgi:hypothetical protein
MTHASVFSGIGGPEVAAAMLGWENLFHCEINPFGRAVLQYWFPKSKSYEDITTTDFSEWGARSTSSREDSLASHSVMPGSDEARMMTATSGRLCTDVLTKSDPIGSFVRTLLESSRWSSKATLLKWRLKKVYSMRLTHFTDTDSTRPLPLNASATTLKVTDIPSKRLLFQLAPLTRRTDETECSSSEVEFIPTFNGDQYEEAVRATQNMIAGGLLNAPVADGMKVRTTHHGQRRMNGAALETLANLLPTPVTQDFKKRGPNSNQQGIGDLVYGMEVLLPTPTAIEGVKWTNTYNPDSQMGQSLSAMAGSGLLPTPLTGEYRDAAITENNAMKGLQDNLSRVVSRIALGINKDGTPMDCVEPIIKLEKDGQNSRLSPLFTEEMMGFPFLWTTLPFLRQSGEPNRSKPTATQ